MCPLGVGSSDSTNTLRTGESKLWILLVGVNDYQDESLPSLRYPALDCQGLGEAILEATQKFPNKEVFVHHDFAAEPPTLERVRGNLKQIVTQAQSPDSILLYFSGHGMLDPKTQQAVLCLSNTRYNDLLETGLVMQDMLQMLGNSFASQQLVCLDTCHSGDMKLLKTHRGSARDGNITETLLNPTPQITQILRQRAAQSKGFCALLSCDQGQKSWEFPELGHGVFTYYLMQGLLGEAADSHGVIEADGLYKYVYRQTVGYIDKLNHQLRLINQQKLNRGESELYPEYPLQTPKRIVEGVGELILGFNPPKAKSHKLRRALVIDGLSNKKITTNLSRLLAGAGGFEVEFFTEQGKNSSELKKKIQEFICSDEESKTKSFSPLRIGQNRPTFLLYLRGHIEEVQDGEAWLDLGDGMRLSRSWLRQELRRARATQQIIIFDCPEASSLENWIEDLQCGTESGQCIIAAAAPALEPELFSRTLLETLVNANPQTGLSIAKWITQLQTLLQAKSIKLHVSLSGTQAIIDILLANRSKIFQDLPALEVPDIRENKQQEQENLSLLEINNSLIDSEKYTNLEQLMKQTVGPISSIILQKAVLQAKSYKELVEDLANYLLPKQQKQFCNRAMAILEASPTQSAKCKRGEYDILDANFLAKCKRELAYSVGPIAYLIIEEVLKEVLRYHPQISLPDLIKKLAEKIPEPKLALEFQNRMLSQKN
jgi:uncharacterized caspase-like protein